MNSKRRAELQRKLTLNAVPRPPAGLAERIKADIPKYLEAESTAQRFTRTINFNLRIAASIVVLATSVVVAMMFVQEQPQRKAAEIAARPVVFPPGSRAVATTDTTTTMQVARTEEVHLDIVQEAPVIPPQLASARVAPPAEVQQRQLLYNEEGRAQRDVETDAEYDDASSFGVAGGVLGGTAEAQPAVVADAQPAEFAPEVPAAEPELAKPEVAAPAPAPARAADSLAITQQAPRLERRRDRAESAKLVPPLAPAVPMPAPASAPVPPPASAAGEAKKQDADVFGISVSAQAFHDIRTTLESGRRPAASAVNVEALVNYFAGAPAKWPRSVRLEVEASPAALPAEGDHAVLRFTVDTPPGTGIAATDARIEVILNNAVVAHARRVGDGDPLARESVLPKSTSVTGLYALELKPGLRSSQVIATVHLHYSVNGKPDKLTKVVQGRDLQKSWQRASRRHRLASLGALWGESLKGTAGGGVDVARRANELATQAPDDPRARELARAASASAAGGR